MMADNCSTGLFRADATPRTLRAVAKRQWCCSLAALSVGFAPKRAGLAPRALARPSHLAAGAATLAARRSDPVRGVSPPAMQREASLQRAGSVRAGSLHAFYQDEEAELQVSTESVMTSRDTSEARMPS